MAVVALILVIHDGDIVFYEAIILLALYVSYILVIYYNEMIENTIKELVGGFCDKVEVKSGKVH